MQVVSFNFNDEMAAKINKEKRCKILVGDYLNLGGMEKNLTFIIMLNIECIYIQI